MPNLGYEILFWLEVGRRDRVKAVPHPPAFGPGWCRSAADEQVWVGSVRPARLPEGEPAEQDLIGEVIQRPGLSRDGQSAVAHVGVAQLEGADLCGPGVHSCQGYEDPDVRGGSRIDGPDDMPGLETWRSPVPRRASAAAPDPPVSGA